MKDHLAQMLERVPSEQRLNRAREYLQMYLLRSLHESRMQKDLAFVGGTALRILHRLPRFSEDLDFSATGHEKFAPQHWMDLFRILKHSLENAAYAVEVKAKAEKVVASAFFRFGGLPFELGWSKDPRVSLSIKFEIDSNPPEGAVLETTLVQQFFPVAVRHYDLPSLFSGKLHALLTRGYVKGRDWFDLVWYLTEHRGLEPNIGLLKNALKQTGGRHQLSDDWRSALIGRIDQLKWTEVLADLKPFVERQTDLAQLQPELVKKLLV